jgi:FKBP-type peptidyl-prolyl cis-trans isomerase FkpA
MRYSIAPAAIMLGSALFLGSVAGLTGAFGAEQPTDAAKADTQMTTTTTDSGLQYQDLVVGTGAQAGAGRQVSVHYTGWLQNPDGSAGRKFDSSVDRGQPFEFPLGAGRVIRGWDEGVAGMKIGGKRRLIIPAALGYGASGAGGAIPPNATLIFDVELLGLQ